MAKTPLLSAAFSDALRELGWVEGRNVVFEYRYAENRPERLPELAADLVRLKVDVIAAAGTLAPLAAKRATATIPIVMTAAGDPLGSGLVASLARPGGNVTGMSLMAPDLGGKRLELLKEVLPRFSRVAVLWNAANPYSALVFKETQTGGQTLGIEVQSLEVRDPMTSMARTPIRSTRHQLSDRAVVEVQSVPVVHSLLVVPTQVPSIARAAVTAAPIANARQTPELGADLGSHQAALPPATTSLIFDFPARTLPFRRTPPRPCEGYPWLALNPASFLCMKQT